MKAWPVTLAIAGLGSALAANAAVPTIASMRDHRRVLVIAAASPDDSRITGQRRLLAGWTRGAADRDVSVVEIAGDRVSGAADNAASLRKRLGISPRRFQVLLIGKDGHVALRSAQPIAATRLQGTIDAMPMRRAGER